MVESRRKLTSEFKENDVKIQERIKKFTTQQWHYEMALSTYDRMKSDLDTARKTLVRKEKENQALGEVTRERNSLRESLL